MHNPTSTLEVRATIKEGVSGSQGIKMHNSCPQLAGHGDLTFLSDQADGRVHSPKAKPLPAFSLHGNKLYFPFMGNLGHSTGQWHSSIFCLSSSGKDLLRSRPLDVVTLGLYFIIVEVCCLSFSSDKMI